MKFLSLCFLTALITCEAAIIEMVPHGFTFNDSSASSNPWDHVKIRLENLGHKVLVKEGDQTGAGDLIIYTNPACTPLFHTDAMDRKKVMVVSYEPPIIEPHMHNANFLKQHFGTVLTYNDDLVDNETIYKYVLYHSVSLQDPKTLPAYDKRKLACMLLSNRNSRYPGEQYSVRRVVAKFYHNHPSYDFDLFGRHWKRYQFRGHYLGEPADNQKYETMKQYRFCFAFENVNIPGYFTEKLFDPMRNLTIPIYVGSETVKQYIPENCFIFFNDFENMEALHHYISNMNEATFLQYQKNIAEFLQSDWATAFSFRAFVDRVLEVITEKLESL